MDQSDLFSDTSETLEGSLRDLAWLLDNSSRLFVKRLTRNDVSTQSHQYGPLIPNEALFGGFFPELPRKADHDGEPIFERFVDIAWHNGEVTSRSRLVYYTSKGEGRVTQLPSGEVIGGPPASYLVIGTPSKASGTDFIAAYLPFGSEATDELEAVCELGPDFHWAIMPSPGWRSGEQSEAETVIADLAALLEDQPSGKWSGRFPVPPGSEIAEEARTRLLANWGIASVDPFEMDRPGDFLHELIKKVEFRTYRFHERRHRVAAVLQAIAAEISNPTPARVTAAIFHRFDDLYDIMMGAAQARRSRVGNSLENHIRAMFKAGAVPHAEQPLLPDSRRPDFILPSLDVYHDAELREHLRALVLTLKTTLRERWMQIFHESADCPIFLATLELSASTQVLDALGRGNAYLVVPESAVGLEDESNFVLSDGKRRWRRPEVITYREFFREVLADRHSDWRRDGFRR